MNYKIRELIKGDLAVAPEDGDIVFEKLNSAFENKEIVILDFSEIDIFTTAFLNNAIGNLYSIHSSEFLNSYLKIENITRNDLFMLKRVIKRAKEKFEGTLLENAIKEEFGHE